MKNIIFFLSIQLLLLSCTAKNEAPKEIATAVESTEVKLTDAQIKNINLETTTLQTNEVATMLKVNGKIDVPPQNLVSISVPLGGYLKYTKLLPGLHINRGEVIAIVEDQQYVQLQQDYLTTKSKLHFAELEYNRQRELNKSQASSDKVTQQAEADLRNNQIILAGLKEKLGLININANNISTSNISKSISITSPINGFATKVNVNIGKYVSPSEVMFELVNPTDIHLNIKVYEKDISSLAIGKKVIAYTNANPTKKYLCEIILINKDISMDGTTEVHCHFETYDNTLLPGMYMNGEIEINRNNANTLPEDAVVSFEGKDFVFVEVGKNKFKMEEVKAGLVQSGYVQINDFGAFLDKKIVTKGAYALLMKMKNTEE
jgi:membrane fusion protein, heavy metal efflux system